VGHPNIVLANVTCQKVFINKRLVSIQLLGRTYIIILVRALANLINPAKENRFKKSEVQNSLAFGTVSRRNNRDICGICPQIF
jgi:hypothetical protein